MFYGLAKRIRNNKVLKLIPPGCSHIDIGSGDNYLLQRSPAKIKCCIKHNAETALPCLRVYFNIITLVAVMEHITNPVDVLKECVRHLTNPGLIIITTPTHLGHVLTPFVSMKDFKEHKHFITYDYLKEILPENTAIVRHEIFECGLNQLFIVIYA